MLPSEVVANYFIQKSFNEGIPLDQMKLLKLVYIAHGWHCGYFHSPLINDAVQAWRYGPVIPDLYRKVRHYGRSVIDAPVGEYPPLQAYSLPDQHTISLLDHVWDSYKNMSGLQLSALTHQQGTPWHEQWQKSGGNTYGGAIIPNNLIEQHYRQKILEQSAQARGTADAT